MQIQVNFFSRLNHILKRERLYILGWQLPVHRITISKNWEAFVWQQKIYLWNEHYNGSDSSNSTIQHLEYLINILRILSASLFTARSSRNRLR